MKGDNSSEDPLLLEPGDNILKVNIYILYNNNKVRSFKNHETFYKNNLIK